MSTSLETPPAPPATALPAPAPASTSAPVAERRKRWTTAEFDRLLAEGILLEGGPAYLWDGDIIEALPENQPHINAVSNLFALLLMRLGMGAWTIDQNGPVELEDGTKPQPDLVVLRGPRSRFATRAATAADVAMLVEVGDTTYAHEVGERFRKYASVGILQYWIVNINARRIELFTGPTVIEGGHAYRDQREFGVGDTVPLRLISEGVETEFAGVAVADVLRELLDTVPEGQVP